MGGRAGSRCSNCGSFILRALPCHLHAREVRRFAEPDKIDRMGRVVVNPGSRPGVPLSEKGLCGDGQHPVAAELVFCFLAALASLVEGDTGSAPAPRGALALGRAAVWWACQRSSTLVFSAQVPHQLLWCQAIPEMLWKVFL